MTINNIDWFCNDKPNLKFENNPVLGDQPLRFIIAPIAGFSAFKTTGIIMTITKICIICGGEHLLNIANWSCRPTSRDGFRSECRECSRERANEYRRLRKERLGEDFKEWGKKFPGKAKESRRKYYQKNKDRLLRKNKARYEKNKGRYLAQMKTYRENNKEKKAASDRKWAINNPEKRAIISKKYNSKPRVRAMTQKRQNKNYKNNPKARLHNAISCGVRNSINNKSGRKAFSLLPYTEAQLKRHIEKQFQSGMTWENIGAWHIDHKVPVSAFNFTKAEHRDFKRCWSLKNLQPMWAKDNLSKGAKLDRPFQPSLAL